MFAQTSIPGRTYHKAQRLGEGACGSITTVFDDDGEVYAMKSFEQDEDGTLALETLRELACLRLLCHPKNAHPNMIRMVDVHIDEDGDEGPEMELVMKKYVCDLEGAIKGKALKKRAAKVGVAYQILLAVSHLHDNGIMHRDIKTENIMFTEDMQVVLIDLGMAKQVDAEGYYGKTHTGDCGTAGYIAPEVYKKEPYGLKADVWSVGVVLLELFRGKMDCDRDKAAFAHVEKSKADMPSGKPVPDLLRALLNVDPTKRPTCREALAMPVFDKVRPKLGAPPAAPRLFVVDAAAAAGAGGKKGGGGAKVGSKRKRGGGKGNNKGKGKGKGNKGGNAHCARHCAALGTTNPMVPVAAARYHAAHYGQPWYRDLHEDDQVDVALQWLHCVLIAAKVYEVEPIDREGLEEEEAFQRIGFDLEQFKADEFEVVKALNFCAFVPFPSPAER